MITYYKITADRKVEAVEDSEEAVWIHLEDPDVEEMEGVAGRLHFPLDYLDSALDPDEVSRFEHPDQDAPDGPILISLLFPCEADDAADTCVYINRTLSITSLNDKLVTCVRSTPAFLKAILDNGYQLILQPHSVRDLIFELAWQITRCSVLVIREVTEEMDLLQERLRHSTKTHNLLRLADLDKTIIYLSTAVSENKPILHQIPKLGSLVTSPEERAWLHDVLVENHQADCMVNQTKQMLERMDTTFSAIIQNNLNEIMKVLTSVTIIITIPMIVAGIWG